MKTTDQDKANATVGQIREALSAAQESHEHAAKLIHELETEGWTQCRIALAVGVSQTTVRRHARWYDLDEPRPAYGESIRHENGQQSHSDSEDDQADDPVQDLVKVAKSVKADISSYFVLLNDVLAEDIIDGLSADAKAKPADILKDALTRLAA